MLYNAGKEETQPTSLHVDATRQIPRKRAGKHTRYRSSMSDQLQDEWNSSPLSKEVEAMRIVYVDGAEASLPPFQVEVVACARARVVVVR